MKELKFKFNNFLEEIIQDGSRGKIRLVHKENKEAYFKGATSKEITMIDIPLCNVTSSGIELGLQNAFDIFGDCYGKIGIIPFENIESFDKETRDDYPLVFCDFKYNSLPYESHKLSAKFRVDKIGESLENISILEKSNITELRIENDNGSYKIIICDKEVIEIYHLDSPFSTGSLIYEIGQAMKFNFNQLNGGITKVIKSEKLGFISTADFGKWFTIEFDINAKEVKGSRIGSFNSIIDNDGVLTIQWSS